MNNIYDKENKILGQVQQIESFTNINLGSVRIANIDGYPYFCFVDVLSILGISDSNRSQMLSDFDNHEHILQSHGYNFPKDYYYIDTPVQTGFRSDGTPAIRISKTSYISEPALYSVITRSRKPQAVEFRAWIYYILLPQARKLGRDETIDSLQRRIKELEEDDKEHYNYAKLVDALLQSYKLPITDQIIVSSRPKDLDDSNDPRNIFI